MGPQICHEGDLKILLEYCERPKIYCDSNTKTGLELYWDKQAVFIPNMNICNNISYVILWKYIARVVLNQYKL